jgi:hypothetical protein
MVVLVAVFGAVLYGGSLFVLAVLDGRSPRTLAWVGFGALLFMVGGLVGRGVATLFGAGEDRATNVSAVVGVLLVISGLGASYYWANVREPALVTALGQVCRGEGVTDAAAPGGTSPRVVVLDDDGHQIDWTSQDAAWRAESVSQAAYVACVEAQDVPIEVCEYQAVPAGASRSIERLEQFLTVRVIEARTATEVGTFDLRDAPRACREVEVEGQGDLHGKVSFAAFSAALEKVLTR